MGIKTVIFYLIWQILLYEGSSILGIGVIHIKKGQIVGALVGLMLAVIIGIGICLPVAIQTIEGTDFTGYDLTSTIVQFIPTLIIAAIIVGIAAVLGMGSRGQARGQLVGALVGLMLAVLIGVGIVLPIAMSVITDTNFSTFTLTETIAGFVPTLITAVIVVGVVAVMGLRRQE